MTTNWAIGVDWDRDGFIAWGARPGDALNLIPSLPQYTNISFMGNLNAAVEEYGAITDYGVKIFRTTCATTQYSGLVFGQNPTNLAVNEIPVSPSTTYTFAAWVRGISNYAGQSFAFDIWDENGTWLNGRLPWTGISSDWTQWQVTFTTGSSTDFVRLAMVNTNATPTASVFEITGMMLVPGSTAPAGFNAGSTSDLYENITDRVLSAEWFLGMRSPYRNSADDSTLDLVLNNADKSFSPENGSSPLIGKIKPLRPVQVRSNDGTDTRAHWVGWLERVEPEANCHGQRYARLIATGAMQFYKAAETKLKLQENKRTDEIIAELIKEVIVPPALSRAWVLGRATNSEMGGSTFLGNTNAYSELDQGKLTLKIAGENWVQQGGYTDSVRDTFDVYRAIGDITAAERGKFLFSREGKALFWNRHHLMMDTTPAATFDDSNASGMNAMQYTYAGMEQTKNEVIVICHPRKISTVSTDVLWELGDSVIEVEANSSRDIYVKYEDENDQRVGAKEVTVGDLEFAEGTATASVAAKANGAELTFTNMTAHTAVITKCVVKGKKITDAGLIEAKAINQGSIIDYGRRTMRVNLPSVDNLEQAQYIADFERNRRAEPRGDVSALTVMSQGKNGGNYHTQQLALTVGDLIRIKETQTAHDKNYYVIGEAHELTAGATLWRTVWYLEPAPSRYPWQLGVVGRSELRDDENATTRLTY